MGSRPFEAAFGRLFVAAQGVTPFTETPSVSRHNGGDSEEEKQWLSCFLEPPSGGFFISRGCYYP